jgi:hypothetical protein
MTKRQSKPESLFSEMDAIPPVDLSDSIPAFEPLKFPDLQLSLPSFSTLSLKPSGS